MSSSRTFWRTVETVAWIAGVVCLVYVAARSIDRMNASRQAVREFTAFKNADPYRSGSVDLTLWSEARIKAWQSTRELPNRSPLAVLRVSKIRLEVPVLEGTDEVTLNRAVGHIEGTAEPGANGNSGIAGHRDGFFRGLKDVVPGDVIELETLRRTERYRIERTWIVNPDDVSVLDPTAAPSVTLVTCYPFYFVGSSPQRFIVRAVHVETTHSALEASLRLWSFPPRTR